MIRLILLHSSIVLLSLFYDSDTISGLKTLYGLINGFDIAAPP